jgi:hypothetical protein
VSQLARHLHRGGLHPGCGPGASKMRRLAAGIVRGAVGGMGGGSSRARGARLSAPRTQRSMYAQDLEGICAGVRNRRWIFRAAPRDFLFR